MDKLTDHLFIMEGMGHGNVKDFNGNYSEWKVRKQIELEEKRNIQEKTTESENKSEKSRKHPEQIVKNEIKKLERKIEEKEKEKAKLTKSLNEQEELEKITEISEKIGAVVQEINALEESWESWVEKLD